MVIHKLLFFAFLHKSSTFNIRDRKQHLNKMKKQLKKYRAKRDFKKTNEPFGADKNSKREKIFVIQKHDASSVHYDFRLEVDGVLKSWAVPKGPSTDPSDKRLAIPTEDHPIEYADFEGVIPEDEYGGGTVMIWDAGTYKNLKENEGDDKEKKSMKQALKEGHATFWLAGKKLKGGYALIRTSKRKDEKWMLIKMDDDQTDARRNPANTENKSVKSGRTIKEIAKESKENHE